LVVGHAHALHCHTHVCRCGGVTGA
jgi:hypothetical protein